MWVHDTHSISHSLMERGGLQFSRDETLSRQKAKTPGWGRRSQLHSTIKPLLAMSTTKMALVIARSIRFVGFLKSEPVDGRKFFPVLMNMSNVIPLMISWRPSHTNDQTKPKYHMRWWQNQENFLFIALVMSNNSFLAGTMTHLIWNRILVDLLVAYAPSGSRLETTRTKKRNLNPRTPKTAAKIAMSRSDNAPAKVNHPGETGAYEQDSTSQTWSESTGQIDLIRKN
jgi:hypothetical protein